MSYSGKFVPKNKSKYKGNLDNIRWRSSWELLVFKRCDRSKRVLEWSSEEIVVPYISQIDGKRHRYFVDIYCKIIDEFGIIHKKLIEIKPYNQTIPPRKKKNKRKYLREVKTFIINQNKWKAAEAFAKKHDMSFSLMTERELGIKK